jgi:hypothetical protein
MLFVLDFFHLKSEIFSIFPIYISSNSITSIPQTSRTKYAQVFQSNDPNSTGFVTAQQAKALLLQTSLPQSVLAQIW